MRPRFLLGLALALCGMFLPGLPAAGGASGDGGSSDAPGMWQAARRQSPWSGGQVAVANADSVSDPTGDVPDPRGDIRSVSLNYTADNPPLIKLDLVTVGAADPNTDPAWNGSTGLIWAIDTDLDGSPDWGVVRLKPGLVIIDSGGNPVCGGDVGYASEPGGGHHIAQFDAACIGGPKAVHFGGIFLLDRDGNSNTTNDIQTDFAPDATAAMAGPVPANNAGVPPPNSQGYWVAAANAAVRNFGRALNNRTGIGLNRPAVGMAATRDLRGGWAVASDGGIFAFGTAQFRGSTGSLALNQPIVGMAATPSGEGYWLVAADGGIFSFGDARFFGSTGSLRLNQPIVGMAATPGGSGYWLVAADGGIFSFGDAEFFGSTGSLRLNQPIVGMAPSISGEGYWLVARDGGIFSFGDTQFHGSTGSLRLNSPIVGMAASRAGGGYRFVAADGGVFCFGDARFEGSAVSPGLGAPVVGMAVA